MGACLGMVCSIGENIGAYNGSKDPVLDYSHECMSFLVQIVRLKLG